VIPDHSEALAKLYREHIEDQDLKIALNDLLERLRTAGVKAPTETPEKPDSVGARDQGGNLPPESESGEERRRSWWRRNFGG
jgi:hypothetical protein